MARSAQFWAGLTRFRAEPYQVPLLDSYSVTFSEAEDPYLRMSFTASLREQAMGIAICSVQAGRPTKYAAFTIGTRGLTETESVQVSSEVYGGGDGKPKEQDRQIGAEESPASEIAKDIAGETNDLFIDELARLRHFDKLIWQTQALCQQTRVAQIGWLVGDIDLWHLVSKSSFEGASFAAGPDVFGDTAAAKHWFNALAWFAAGCFAIANPFLGAFAGGAAAYFGDKFNSDADAAAAQAAGAQAAGAQPEPTQPVADPPSETGDPPTSVAVGGGSPGGGEGEDRLDEEKNVHED
jgi:hypothetical protein